MQASQKVRLTQSPVATVLQVGDDASEQKNPHILIDPVETGKSRENDQSSELSKKAIAQNQELKVSDVDSSARNYDVERSWIDGLGAQNASLLFNQGLD